MPKRFSSTEGWLGFALRLARTGRCEAAQKIVRRMEGRELISSDLRTIAQINNRCESLSQAEACWLEIDRRGEMESGDFYMLGSLQARLRKLESAARSFEREIEVATATGESYFMDSSSIRLADLMVRLGQPLRAEQILASVGDEVGDYVDDVGFRTKAAILQDGGLSKA